MLYVPYIQVKKSIDINIQSRDFIQYLREFFLDQRTADIYLISDFNKCRKSIP